ncbi:hypothetical protein EYF80_027217 [Liparis tanakae]|uniref:ZP domain-containing protein n=1 Tax=Liparis tanakae TaxID=230148 RepID=A0A4Z2H9R0_9TELE|nr:hypothetical protein EYF80_027217 [Liparis tanakae]
MFTFTKDEEVLQNEIFVHCDVEICDSHSQADGSCRGQCVQPAHQMNYRQQGKRTQSVSSSLGEDDAYTRDVIVEHVSIPDLEPQRLTQLHRSKVIHTDLGVLYQVVQREDGIGNHIRVVVKAAHPALVCFRWVFLVEDVREILLPADDLDLMGHEALVEAHAHVALQEVIALVGQGGIAREETQGHSEFKVQAVFDV